MVKDWKDSTYMFADVGALPASVKKNILSLYTA